MHVRLLNFKTSHDAILESKHDPVGMPILSIDITYL